MLEVNSMDREHMKKLNKQGLIFVALHTIILFDLAAEFWLFS